MKNRSLQLIFHMAFIFGLLLFLIFFYFDVTNILLTYYIVTLSSILMVYKLQYWYSIRNISKNLNSLKIKDTFFLRATICIFIYISPAYCIIQEPFLIVDKKISFVTFIIITLLAVVGMVLEKCSFIEDSKERKYENNI